MTTPNTWTDTANIKVATYQHKINLLPNGNVLVSNGVTNNGGVQSILNKYQIYNYTTGLWEDDKTMPGKIYHTATSLANGNVLIAGGSSAFNSNDTTVLNTCFIYDWVNDSWNSITVPNLTTARFNHSAVLLSNGKVLVSGGSTGSTTYDSCEIYNPETNTWSQVRPMNLARNSHQSILLPNNKVLVACVKTFL